MSSFRLNELPSELKAGYTYDIVADEYDLPVTIQSSGTKEAPITIRANKGLVLTNKTQVIIKGDWVIFDGFEFRGIRQNKTVKLEGNNNRITNCKFWDLQEDVECIVRVLGQYNRLDNNTFTEIKKEGCLIVVDTEEDVFCMIDNNKFSNRSPTENNNGLECIRIGDSNKSLNKAKCVVYANSFSKCDGEIEIISVKSCENLIMGNKVFESKGTITLRHGKDNVVRNNWIDCSMVEDSGGIRIIDSGHLIFSNTIDACNSYNSFRTPISIMCGEANNELNGYAPVDNVQIKYNTVSNSRYCYSAGVDNKRGSNILPTNITMSDNRWVKCAYVKDVGEKCLGFGQGCVLNNYTYDAEQTLDVITTENNNNVDIKEFYEKYYVTEIPEPSIDYEDEKKYPEEDVEEEEDKVGEELEKIVDRDYPEEKAKQEKEGELLKLVGTSKELLTETKAGLERKLELINSIISLLE